MKLDPVPFFGRTLRERDCNGLGLNLGYYPAGRQSLHVHAWPSFSVLVVGKGRERTRRDEYPQPPLSVVFNPSSEPHGNDIGPGGVLGFTLSYAPAWLEQHGLTERALGDHRMLAPSVWSRLATLHLLGRAFDADPVAAGDLETCALEMLEPLVSPVAPQTSSCDPAWLRRGEEFLHEHFRSPITLRSVAAEAGVHPVYFARVFRRRHGCSVSAFLRALRLAEAGHLILKFGGSMAHAACAAGFADQAHLCRSFAREFGFTPRSLRLARLPPEHWIGEC
jgi:AraC family transcriptional regulator